MTERSGNEIKYKAEIIIDGVSIPNVSISDRRSLYEDKKRLFKGEHDGKKVIVGNIEKLTQKKDVNPQNIEILDLSDVTMGIHFSPYELFSSEEMLRTVAKISYEWFCYTNKIEAFDPIKYQNIVDCVLLKQPVNDYVGVVEPLSSIANVLKDICYYGSHGLFEYDDIDGFKYVIYCFWGIIYYKVRICKLDHPNTNRYNTYDLYLYDIDGTKRNVKLINCGASTFLSIPAQQAIKDYHALYAANLECLAKTTILTLSKVKKLVNDLKKAVNEYKSPPHEFARLVDYEDNERIETISVVLFLFANKDKYDFSKSFTQNLKALYSIDDTIIIKADENKKYVADLLNDHNKGVLLNNIENAITFFEKIVANES